MAEPIAVGMMEGEALLWRCLHGGPLSAATVDAPSADGRVPWAEFRERNLAFLRNLTRTYGACAVIARAGERFVGHLRFYPKSVYDLAKPGLGLCMQQAHPYGPAGDLGNTALPPLKDIEDKTLLVHCMMLAPDEPGRVSLRRLGIGTRMARTLIDWAAANGWEGIEATAYEPLPVIYAASGQASPRFWEKLGFCLARAEPEPALSEENEFVRTMLEQARSLGIDPSRIKNRYVMRLDIRKVGK